MSAAKSEKKGHVADINEAVRRRLEPSNAARTALERLGEYAPELVTAIRAGADDKVLAELVQSRIAEPAMALALAYLCDLQAQIVREILSSAWAVLMVCSILRKEQLKCYEEADQNDILMQAWKRVIDPTDIYSIDYLKARTRQDVIKVAVRAIDAVLKQTSADYNRHTSFHADDTEDEGSHVAPESALVSSETELDDRAALEQAVKQIPDDLLTPELGKPELTKAQARELQKKLRPYRAMVLEVLAMQPEIPGARNRGGRAADDLMRSDPTPQADKRRAKKLADGQALQQKREEYAKKRSPAGIAPRRTRAGCTS